MRIKTGYIRDSRRRWLLFIRPSTPWIPWWLRQYKTWHRHHHRNCEGAARSLPAHHPRQHCIRVVAHPFLRC